MHPCGSAVSFPDCGRILGFASCVTLSKSTGRANICTHLGGRMSGGGTQSLAAEGAGLLVFMQLSGCDVCVAYV